MINSRIAGAKAQRCKQDVICAENYKQFHVTRKHSKHREDKDKEATRGHVLEALATF